MTPKRPEAICLIDERRLSPKRDGSSPPSPVFDLPPSEFIATASDSCVSLLIEPRLIAPVQKRLTISLVETTSSSGTGGTSSRNCSRPRMDTERDCSTMVRAYSA